MTISAMRSMTRFATRCANPSYKPFPRRVHFNGLKWAMEQGYLCFCQETKGAPWPRWILHRLAPADPCGGTSRPAPSFRVQCGWDADVAGAGGLDQFAGELCDLLLATVLGIVPRDHR